MSDSLQDYLAISKVLQHYIDGAKHGRGAVMRPAFHVDASLQGCIGGELFAGPIQKLFDWNDSNGPASELVAHIVSVDIVETVASVRMESDNWSGHRYTDFFNLLKLDGQWQVVNKVFHLHATQT